jgi:hypothetical protein
MIRSKKKKKNQICEFDKLNGNSRFNWKFL